MTYLKINETLYPAYFRMRTQDSQWGGRASMAMTLTMDYATAAELFQDGVEWSLARETESGDAEGNTSTGWEITDQPEFEVAGPITDNRDGTVTVKMGKALAGDINRELTGSAELTVQEAKVLRGQMEAVYEKASATMTADEAIWFMDLCKTWTAGSHTAGEVYRVDGQLWQCIQDYDNAVYPDIVPGGSAWGTFHKPYHGTSEETALEWVAPTGAHDMYLAGEYMVWTDGKTYRCISGTAYSPAEYAGAWEVVE